MDGDRVARRSAARELLERHGTLNYARAARVGLELLEVLEAAHGQGVTHGELSPGQVWVREEGSVVVTGFGLAGAALVPRLTAPSYASPEQARDERFGPAADLWTLGALLYAMAEGRPPFRDRGRPEATLRGVERLPLRTPVRAGPLAQTVRGLLRKDHRERLTHPVVRAALTRVLTEDPDAAVRAVPRPRLRGACAAAREAGRPGTRRATAAVTVLAVVAVTAAVLAVTHGLPGPDGDRRRRGPRAPLGPRDTALGRSGASRRRGALTAALGLALALTAGDPLPAGFRRYDAPEASPSPSRGLAPPGHLARAGRGLPGRLRRGRGPAHARGHPQRAGGEDPVAVWRDDVEPGLRRSDGEYRRIGAVRATTYRGREAADMEWVVRDGGERRRTFGRASSWAADAASRCAGRRRADDWAETANQKALAAVLATFREGPDGHT